MDIFETDFAKTRVIAFAIQHRFEMLLPDINNFVLVYCFSTVHFKFKIKKKKILSKFYLRENLNIFLH